MKRRGRPPYPDLLTPREQEVLALLRDGLSNDQIAERLGVSLAGAKYHVSEILGKLGVSSREEAARWQQERPWWLSAFAPIASLRHRLGWAPQLTIATAVVALAAGVGLLVWGLTRTNGEDGTVSALCAPGEIGNYFIDVREADEDSFSGPASSTNNLDLNQNITVGVNSSTRWSGIVQSAPDIQKGMHIQAAGPWQNDCTLLAASVFSSSAVQATVAPTSTPRPYAAEPIDCTGGFDTPEEAIGACYHQGGAGSIFVGDCDTPDPAPPTDNIFDRPCSIWEDGIGGLRSYQIGNSGTDGFVRLIVEEAGAGWQVTMRAGCSIQNEINRDYAPVDLSVVRVDDCRQPPQPLVRPTLYVGPEQAAKVSNGRSELTISRGKLYPGRGVKLGVSVQNITSTTLPWTADDPSKIEVVAEDGTSTAASEVGGTLARSVPGGMPADALWYGWLVLPIEQTGVYTLRYPGQPDLLLDLTPIDCEVTCGSSKPE
jgi:DNA-binding CsgD family transcriptional regulator